MFYKFQKLIFLTVIIGLTSCSGLASLVDNSSAANNIAAGTGFYKSIIRTKDFNLVTFSRLRSKGAPIDIYIEGDGLAYLSRARVSYDPTPRNPVGLRLAAEDSAPNVVYIGRPCQYDSISDTLCKDFAYWTNKRFSEEVVASVNQAIDVFLLRAHSKKINLIGFSGGGSYSRSGCCQKG